MLVVFTDITTGKMGVINSDGTPRTQYRKQKPFDFNKEVLGDTTPNEEQEPIVDEYPLDNIESLSKNYLVISTNTEYLGINSSKNKLISFSYSMSASASNKIEIYYNNVLVETYNSGGAPTSGSSPYAGEIFNGQMKIVATLTHADAVSYSAVVCGREEED